MRNLLSIIFLLPLTACFFSKKGILQPIAIAPRQIEILDSTLQYGHCNDLGKDTVLWEISYQYYHHAKEAWQERTNQQIVNWFKQYYEIENEIVEPNKTFYLSICDSLNKRAQRQYKQGEIILPWHFMSNCSIDDQSPDFVEICFSEKNYFGGIKEIQDRQFMHLSKKTAKPIELKDFISDSIQFQEIAEQYFKKENQFQSYDNYIELGFWFEQNHFVCSNNFSFQENEMRFYYHPLEIAQTSKGIIEFGIPYSEIKHLLKIQVR